MQQDKHDLCERRQIYRHSFFNFERQRLPYVDFSNGYLKFTPFITGKGRYTDINIYSISQRADRKFITAVGDSSLVPFGLDGPHVRNTTEQGYAILTAKITEARSGLI